ncbi:MAG: ABC transporter ATP-binding protein [Verrucomicrobiota bacterium]
MSEAIVELDAVSKWYGDSEPEAGEPRRILDRVDWSVGAGDRLAIVGPSGCGKSTLLNLLGTLDQPSEGEVKITGQSSGGLSEAALAALRARSIGFVFQMHHLLPQCTALENVLVATLAKGIDAASREGRTDRAHELLGRVGLGDKVDRLPGQLSGGERQRVAVVRSLINEPRLLLADEPTGALDEDNARRLVDLLVELNETEKLALVLVTHDQTLARSIGSLQTIINGKIESLA